MLVFACGLDVATPPEASEAGGDGGGAADGGAARQMVADSSYVPPDEAAALPPPPPVILGVCDGGLSEEANCDPQQGLGCCVRRTIAECMASSDVAALCTSDVFIGCVRPDNDSACCWNGRRTSYAGDCGDNPSACLGDEDCPTSTCHKKTCGTFAIGACGSDPKCPNES